MLREQLALTTADDMRLVRTETDELGFTHERYQPYFQGVKVEHASVSLHVRGGRIETLSGDFDRPTGSPSASPALSEATALQRAMAAVGARQYMWQLPAEEIALKQQTGKPAATYRPKGELVWVRHSDPTTAAQGMVLAWKFNIYAADPVSRAWIYVDARTGREVLRDNIIKHVNAPGATFATRYLGTRTSITDNTGSGYRLRETATSKGVTTLNLRKSTNFATAIDFIDNDNNWTAAEFDNANFDNAALDAHLGAQVTQDYWTNIHGRDSYDDKGSVLLSYVHYGNGTDNAFWNGTAMLYGDGSTAFKPLTAIDVCGHEIGHAVCETTANLVYQNESGAMNEGFSDIWGCCVENHLDPTKQKYLIGEDICKPSFGLALRSMSNPNQFSQPDTYKGTNWATGAGDNGGVHTNSGVLNFWFFLLSNGGSGTNDFGTAFNVPGIGIAKAEKIAYRTERVYLTASSDYAACRKAAMQAAIDLYGLGSAEVQSTAKAWRAVGVGTTTGAAEGAPTITGFTPTSGLAGTVVTITGTNLGATMRVTFNGADATIATLTSGTSLTVTVPSGASTGLISLSTAAGTVTTSGLSPANFTITAAGPAPVITSFLPSAGQAQGFNVIINGSNFTGATAVTFNGTAATSFTVTSATSILATVPAGATTGQLAVTTPNGTAIAPTIFKVRPAINSFSPTSGVVGTAVTLTGTSLTGTLSVKFNGVYVSSFTVVNPTTITTTVPNGATTGQISLHAPDGDTISLSDFTVTPSLAFTNFSPTSGAVTTTVVNIKGRGFTGTSAITFGGVNAPTFTVASDLELFVTVPVGAITGNIVVTTPLGQVTSPVAFTVTAPLVPTITGFTPASGVVGDAVTITGTNFTGATAVTFNGTAATYTVSSATTIFTTVPAGATSGVIRVTVPGGTATSASNFSVVLPGAPTITSFTPANGNVGTVVTLTGTNFSSTTAVAFNGTPAAFTLVSSTSITATAPAGGTTGQISVTNGFGTGVSATSFFYPPTNDLCANSGLPVLTCGGSVSGTTLNSTSTGDPTGTCTTSVQATAGGVFYRFVGTGGSVTMTTCAAGTNYDTKLFVFTGTCGSYTCVTGNDDLTGTCAANGSTTPSTITFTSVAGTNYFVFVSGFNSGQGNFTITTTCTPVVPTITSFTPTSGPVGTSVGLTGTNFTAASAVTFNGTAATAFTVNSATSITATVPAGATTGPIGVTVPGGSGVSASNFTVLVAPTLTSLSPNSGVVGASITLTGTDFTGATGISFNSTAAVTFSVTNATTATATVPVGATTGNVTITTPGGTSNGVAFTVLTAPVVTALNPTRNLRNSARVSNVAVTFDQAMSNGAASAGAVKVFSQQRGGRMSGVQGGAASVSGNTITFNPTTDFKPGETVFVTTTTAAQSSTGANLARGHVHQFTAAAGVGPGTFSGGPSVAVGTNSRSLAVADIDSDGDLDILAASAGDNTANVRVNNGNGIFSGSQAVAVGTTPSGIVTADIDGDGDLDLLTVNANSDNVSVRVNDGVGTFSGSQTVAVGTNPAALTTGDVDGDGDLDLLVANFISTSVSILFNDGTGIFSGTTSVAVNGNPLDLTLADVEGDGDLDILTANTGFNTVSVRLNNGAGLFSGATNVPVGDGPQSVVAADIDADGDLDFLTSNYFASTVSVRINNGAGNFSGATDLVVGTNPNGLVVSDVEGDGDLDFLVATSNTTVNVRLNDGSGSFSSAPDVVLSNGPIDLALADIDGDTDLDMLAITGNTVSVRFNQLPPSLISLSPTSGQVGTSVTLTGTGFIGATSIRFNGSSTAFSVINATTATATVPSGATSGPVTVILPSGTTNGVAFTVTHAPTAIGLSPQSVAENTPGGTAIGNFSTTDPDAGDTFTYSLVSGAGSTDNGAFSISNGQLVITNAPDFETKSSYAIRVRTTDQGSLFFEQTFTITVTNQNEGPSISPQTFSVAENSANGTLVGNVAASDPDAGTSLTYSISGGNTGGTFSFVGNQLVVANHTLLDFESNPTFSLTVQVSDGALTASATVTINLTNQNEAPSISPQTFSVNENSPAGTVVGTVAASDPDAGSSLTYSIIGGNTGAAFTFVGNQLRVQFSNTLDFETLPTYSLTVRVNDGSLFANATVTVNLNDLNENPTAVSLAGQSVPENSPTGTSVGSLSTTGPGSGYTYTLVSGAGSSGNAVFTIVGDLLQTAAVLDFETQNSYAVRIRATDTGNGGAFLEQTFTISVTNLNDAPTALGLSPQSVAENVAGGTAVGTFTTTDPDAGNTFFYALVSGAGSTDNGAFSISGNQLLITASPDFETKSSYAVRVRTSDQFGLTFEQPFTITVTDENEAPSVNPQTFSVAENAANGTAVGTVSASDPDAGTTLTYSITAGNTGGAFSFVGNQLRVANSAMLDFETTPTFSLTVQVSDGALANSATVTVNLTDVVETAPDLTVSTAQTIPAGTYRNITITGTGTGTLGGAVVVQGALLVQNGGTFEDGCQVLTGPGSFTLETGATLRICHAQGIAASGASGAVQVTGPRAFSTGASYIYAGAGAQITGTGLPATVQNLSSENASDVTLTLGTRIRRVLTLASSGNLQLGEAPLTLLSDAAGTAMVANAGSGRVIGTATAQRYLSPNGVTGLGYHHLSSPVENTTVADLTVAGTNGFVPVVNTAYNAAATPSTVRPYPTVFGFDETRYPTLADFSRGYFSPAALTSPLVSGRGYSVYMKPLTPDFVGTLATGTVSVGNLTRTGAFLGNAEKSGWHLLGNPYPSPIDWDLVTVPAGMDASISVFQTKGGNNGIYLTRANGLGTLPDGLVAMGQAFFARVTGAAPVPFAFDNSMRVTSYANPNAFRAAPDARPTVQLVLARQGAPADERDAVTVYFQEGATAGADARFDGFRPGRNEGTFPTLATVVTGENGGEAAVDGRPLDLLRTGTVVELLANLPQAGTWSLTLAQLTNLDATPLVLLDRLTGTRTPLVAGGRYSFAVSAGGVVKGRFALVVGAEQAATPTLTLWPNPAHQAVQLVVPTGTTEVTVFDATGRAVKRIAVTETDSALNLSLVGLPTGVYVVKAAAAAARLVVE